MSSLMSLSLFSIKHPHSVDRLPVTLVSAAASCITFSCGGVIISCAWSCLLPSRAVSFRGWGFGSICLWITFERRSACDCGGLRRKSAPMSEIGEYEIKSSMNVPSGGNLAAMVFIQYWDFSTLSILASIILTSKFGWSSTSWTQCRSHAPAITVCCISCHGGIFVRCFHSVSY